MHLFIHIIPGEIHVSRNINKNNKVESLPYFFKSVENNMDCHYEEIQF